MNSYRIFRTRSQHTAKKNSPVLPLAVLANLWHLAALWFAALEGDHVDIDEVFDESFMNQLDESFFGNFSEEPFIDEFLNDAPLNQKRKRDDYDHMPPVHSDSTELSDEWPESESDRVSPSYDIERMSPGESCPSRKRRRFEADAEVDDISFANWNTESDASWEMLPAFEDTQPLTENDSWQMSPQKNIDLPYANVSQNPIGHILSNGIRTVHTEASKPAYMCRACARDLKGHQHNPTMHFMLPKHEKCWHKIAEDTHLSSSISKALYPPQWVEKSSKGNTYFCKQCGQKGSKRKVVAHVMGAKCKELRKSYADTLAWNGIEDEVG
ncbi:hypothetical protein XU18_2177 [Perkinsela sp. CCAP 1560/4]|nr:hypothetical protein XU18_2177 [Perkinsela sp. CCAP 1560/4]|eukprot:KNH07132.1 hypothetical protein XU18_2177 [Perkinsela sp. CCAP 1560/4]